MLTHEDYDNFQSEMSREVTRRLGCFANDLRECLGLPVEFVPTDDLDGLHCLRVRGVEFRYYADGTGYDGCGLQPGPPASRVCRDDGKCGA
jgi:hypothetical protein